MNTQTVYIIISIVFGAGVVYQRLVSLERRMDQFELLVMKIITNQNTIREGNN